MTVDEFFEEWAAKGCTHGEHEFCRECQYELINGVEVPAGVHGITNP